MKAIIKLDVPEWQIGQEVRIYFPDTMVKYAKCEAVNKNPKQEKLLPCICGGKRRERWYGMKDENSIILKCCKCGFRAAGKNEADARRKWNEAVKEKLEE